MAKDPALKKCRYNAMYKSKIIAAINKVETLPLKRPHEMKINYLEAIAASRGINVVAIRNRMPARRKVDE